MSQTSDFVCDYCSRSFSRKYNLQIHIENCHMNTSCYCEICNQKYRSPAGLGLHYLRGHNMNNQPLPECDVCGRIFTRKQNIRSHMITVHLQGIWPEIKCLMCEKTFTTERNLKRHNNLLHNPHVEYPTCDECNKVFKGKHALIAHIQAVHAGSEKGIIKCHLCEKVYTNNRNLKRHLEMYHGEKGEFRCDICPKVYTSNQSLRRHARTTHCTPDAEEHSCDYCGKMITGKENLDRHVELFHKDDTLFNKDSFDKDNHLACKLCSEAFDEERLLRHHVKAVHGFSTFYKYCRKSFTKQTDRNAVKGKSLFYNCEFCHHAFINVYELKAHMRINHEKEYALSTCNVCFNKFYSKDTMTEHRKSCLPPPDVNSCTRCDKLFTDISSLEFHTRIFHPQTQIADSNITSTHVEETVENNFKCTHCDRLYYSDRSLKHHVKLKHTTGEAIKCGHCEKICSNKYYLASHIKIHTNDAWSKCDYCDKMFKSKRNIRRHIEYTHLGMQRYKCIECETLFKEKRSLRKHVRTKHPNSAIFPQCHICHKRFESAKSCKIHLKLLHSFNMNTFPCHLCSVSFSSKEVLTIHLQTKHLAEDEIYKCEECNLVFKGQEKFEQHNDLCHVNLVPNIKQKVLPRCIICMKDFSTRKTLKRHIKKFHEEFDVDELATFGSRRRFFSIECEDCIKSISDDTYINVYQKLKHSKDSVVFTCETCNASFNTLEYFIQRYKLTNTNFDGYKTKMILSEFCTAEMSDDEAHGMETTYEEMEPVSTTGDLQADYEDNPLDDVKIETMSP